MKTFDPIKFLCTSALAVLFFVLANASLAQTLTTDKSDYPPGATVTLTGSGFSGGETVTLQVLHVDNNGDNDTSAAHQPWNVSVDDDGNFTSSWFIPADEDESGATLSASADGQSSGAHAEVTFTDNPNGTGVV